MRFGPWSIEDLRDTTNAFRELSGSLARVEGNYSTEGAVETRTLDAATATATDVANVLATLIEDLKKNGWGIR